VAELPEQRSQPGSQLQPRAMVLQVVKHKRDPRVRVSGNHPESKDGTPSERYTDPMGPFTPETLLQPASKNATGNKTLCTKPTAWMHGGLRRWLVALRCLLNRELLLHTLASLKGSFSLSRISTSRLLLFVCNTRPWSFPASLGPVALAGAASHRIHGDIYERLRVNDTPTLMISP